MGIFWVGIFREGIIQGEFDGWEFSGGKFSQNHFSGFFFQTKITVSFKKTTLQKNVVIVEEELDGTDIDEAVNLEDSPRFAFIDEECENLIVVKGENVLEIKTKRRSQAFHNSLQMSAM